MRRYWDIIKQFCTHVVSMIKQSTKKIWTISQRYYTKQKLFVSEKRQFTSLHKQPWYFVLGESQSGRSQLIAHSGFHSEANHLLSKACEFYKALFPRLSWDFNANTCFITNKDETFFEDEANIKPWLKTLARHRRQQPLNGVIMTIDINEWLYQDKSQQQRLIQRYAKLLIRLSQQLKEQIPVYLVWTKMDRLIGFNEFFHELSREELEQIWGLTFPITKITDLTLLRQFLHQEYPKLVQRLQERVIHLLDSEKSAAARELIYAFPQQIQLLAQPIADFIHQLISALPQFNLIHLRGFYFTSASQTGQQHNLLLHSIANEFSLVPIAPTVSTLNQECYFIRNLFEQLIYPESRIMGFSHQTRKRKQYTYQSAWLVIPLLLIYGIWQTAISYHYEIHYLTALKSKIAYYKHLRNNLDFHNPDITTTLPLLQQAHRILNPIHHYAHFGMNLLFNSHQLRTQANNLMQRTLASFFVPRIALTLENQLHHNKMNINFRYATLKGYLVFNPQNQAPTNNLIAPMKIYWAQHFKGKPNTLLALNYYLNQAVLFPQTALPIDHDLVSQNRDLLQQVIPSQRAYVLLQFESRASALNDINFAQLTGSAIDSVFVNSTTLPKIPAFYTLAGFQHIFSYQLNNIANEVANDNHEIGLSSVTYGSPSATDIKDQVKTQYSQDYLNQWDNALKALDVKSFDTYDNAEKILTLLGSNQSPLFHVLNIVKRNTTTIDDDSIQVKQHFYALNHFYDHSQAEKLSASFTAIKTYLQTIQNQNDPNKAAFDAAKQYFMGAKNPIYQLQQLAKDAPAPAKRWLETIADNTLALIFAHARDYINAQWQKDIILPYGNEVMGHYPINIHAVAQLDLNTFQTLFAPKGKLDQFFVQFIQPFVNSDGPNWQYYQRENGSIELSTATLVLFERAKRIQNDFFNNTSGTPSLELTIEPRLLDTNLMRFNLAIGNQNLAYAHGPRQSLALHWPLGILNQSVTLSMIDFNHNPDEFHSSGPWSLFKLFDRGQWQPGNNPNNYNLILYFNHRVVELTINSTLPLATLKLTDLEHFNLVSTL